MKPIWMKFLILAVIGFALGAGIAQFQARALPEAGAQMETGAQVGGAFSLIDQQGHPVTEKSWPGKYKLVFFGYTRCKDTCPATLEKLCTVLDNYDPKAEKLAPLFITVDPARDTPKVMAKYVENFKPHVTGLTGTPAQVKAAEAAYKVYAAKAPGSALNDYETNHSSYVYFMSPDDKLLEIFDGDETVEGMIAKIRLHIQ